MSNPWFRFYAAALRNPKVAALSDREFRLWVSLLSAASENDGRLPPAQDLKHMLNARLDHLLSGLERLIRVGLIDALEHGYEPHNWSKFQYKSDTSTERVKKHRADRNVSGTPPDTEQIQKQIIEPIAQHSVAAAPREPMLLDRLLEAAGLSGFREDRHPGLLRIEGIRAMIDKGYSLESDILPVIRDRSRNATFTSWNYFTQAIIEAAAAKSAIPQRPAAPSEDWAGRMAAWHQDATWIHAWGPKPGERGCRVPRELIERTAA